MKAADLESLAVQKILATLAPYHLLVMEKKGDLVVTCSVLKKVKCPYRQEFMPQTRDKTQKGSRCQGSSVKYPFVETS